MRIIAGIARGLPLTVPRNGMRPTTDRTREALFSSLGDRVAGARVLDLYAGSGSLGLEAASRGAAAVVFVERQRSALLALEQNIAAFCRGRQVRCDFQIARGDVVVRLKTLGSAGRFDLILADPPYGDTAQRLLENPFLPGLLNAQGLLALESGSRDPITPHPPWQLKRTIEHGDTRVSVLALAESSAKINSD